MCTQSRPTFAVHVNKVTRTRKQKRNLKFGNNNTIRLFLKNQRHGEDNQVGEW